MEEIKKQSSGRPAWIPSQADIDKAEALAGRGLTKDQIADCLGISYQTLNEKTKEYTEFSDAIKRGKANGIAHVTNKLMKVADEGNVTAIIFWLKCQADWKEKSVVENTGKDGEPIKHEHELNKQTLEAINDRINQMMEKR